MQAFHPSILLILLTLLSNTFAATNSVAPDTTLDEVSSEEDLHDVVKRAASDSTAIIMDNETYYKAVVTTATSSNVYYTQQFDAMFGSLKNTTVVKTVLDSNSTWNNTLKVQLKFLFYFFGHPVSRIAIAGNGSIFITEPGHEPGQFPQYIAPLMAEYDSGENASSTVTYVATDSSIWVRWTDLALPGTGASQTASFQCAIFKNGSMVFHYYNLPKLSKDIPGIKAGVADVYNYKTNPLDTQIKEIFVHRIENLSITSIVNKSVALITALPSCGQLISCGQCLTSQLAPTFNCSWCFERGECGASSQRALQTWIAYPCHYPADSSCTVDLPVPEEVDRAARGVLAFFLALFLAMTVAFVVGVCVYGHRKPESRIGQTLLQMRRQLRDCLTGMPRLPTVSYRASNSQVRLQEEM